MDIQENWNAVQLGWITGFSWSASQIIDYKKYSEILHGNLPKQLVPIILRKYKSTRKLKDHVWIDIFRVFILIIFLLALLFVQFQKYHFAFIVIFIAFLLREFEEKIGCLGTMNLRNKINELTMQLNKQFEPVGIYLKFPSKNRKMCLLFSFNFLKYVDYSTLEIWKVSEELSDLGTTLQDKKIQKIQEDQSVFV